MKEQLHELREQFNAGHAATLDALGARGAALTNARRSAELVQARAAVVEAKVETLQTQVSALHASLGRTEERN